MATEVVHEAELLEEFPGDSCTMQTIEAAGGLICDTHVTVLSEETVVEDVVCEQKYYDDRNYEFEFAQPATNNNSVEYTDDLQLHERLQPRVAVHLLENVPEERCLNVAPDKPQHGDWYVYSYLHDLKRRRLWQRDGHSWRNYGLRKEKYRGRLLHKRYFRQINGSNLSRIVYELVGEHYLPRFLVQYIDDSRVPKGVAFMGGCSTNTSVTGRQRKHSIRKDALRRRLYTMLTDWQASELLVKTVKGSCCTTPANKPTNGYWYIFKYGQDQTRSDLWKDDGLQWVQHSSSAVHVGSRLLLKRQYIRYVEGSRVDFIRRSYEFVDPAAASLAGLGSLTAEQAVRQHTAEREASEAGETVTSEDVFAGDEDEADEFVGFDSSDPIDKRGAGAGGKSSSRLNGEASSNNGDKQKQRNSWKWSPTHSTNKEKKTPKLVIKEEETFDHHSSNSHDSPLSDLTDIAFNRVLVHYLGHDDAVDLPAPKPKKSTKSGGSRQAQVALCRAVPLTCTDGTLQTSNVGPNRGIHRRLHPREAAHLLEMTPQPDCIPYVPLPHPRAGLWCVLSGDLEDSSASSWSSDGYNWRLLSCLSLAVGDHSLLIKRYRRTVRGLGVHLYRYAYCLAHCDRARVLVHYIGLDDEPETFQSPDDFSGAPPVRCKEEGAVDETGFLDADTWPQVREEDYRHGRWQYLQDEEEQPDTSTVLNKDGLSVMVITRLLIPLEIATVIHLLEDTPEEDCLTFAPGNPKNGHWFVFTYAGLHPICQKGWKKDYYRWRHNGTHKRVIQDKNLNIRYYKRIVTGRGAHFMRYTYEILDEEGNNVLQRMLVHYLGRDDIPEPASSYSPKLRAKLGIGASVFVKVGDLMEGQYYTVMCSRFIPDLDVLPAEDPAEPPALGGSYGSVMEQQDHMFVDSQYGAIMKPRRSTKPRAIQSGIDKSNNFFLEEVLPSPDLPSCVVEEASSRYPSEEGDSSVDSGMPYVYRIGRSIIDMVYDFLYKIKETHSIFFQVIPTTIVVIACKSNMNEYKAMRVSSNANLVVYYDKTWKVDNLYVSSLYTKHIMCECETLFPLAFAIHELDDAPSHRTILEQMLQSCKALDSADTVILTDASPCLLSACAESLPKCIRASSWTNILEAVNLWFSRNEPTCDGWTITVDSVAKLLRTRSFDEYSLKYQEFSSTWVPQFRGFYDETLSDVVIASNAGSLQTLGMYSKHGLTITGLRDFLEQMGCLFTDVEVSSLEALTSMVYYVLYYYHNEIEKGKLKEVGTAFRRKRQFFSPMVKKRCFFPTRCALPEDVAGTILVKMKVPSFVAKKEPLQSFAIDEDDEETNVRELVNIEVDVDLDANNGIGEEEFEQITILETEPLGLKAEKITCVTETNEGEPLVYSQRSTDDEMDPAEHSFGRSKRPRLRLASDAVLFDQFDDDKSEDFIPGPVKRRGRPRKRKPSGILSPLKKPSMKRARKSDSYMRGGGKNLYDKRKKMVNLGHSLWASGRVSFDPGAETYFVSGARGAVECVKLSPAQHCSCGSRDRCKHVVAALLESLCADDAEEDKCLFTPARDRKPDFPTLLQSTTLDLQFEDDEFGTEETVFLEPSFDVDNDEI